MSEIRPATPDPEPTGTASNTARHWEERYGSSPVWSGRVNESTAAAVARIEADGAAPGRALDLGCGEGADAIWLAGRGWTVTGADISTTAIRRARAAAHEAGIPEGRLRFVAQDLDAWVAGDTDPDQPLGGAFDLITASFFHSTVELARTAILRRAASSLAAGGHLVIVSHAAPPPWSGHAQHGDHGGHAHDDLLDPAGELAALELDPARYTAVLAETRTRTGRGPEGQEAELEDGVLVVRRTP